ncbi:MAG TPA: OmpA family protein [Opitutaceae bacterium]
MKFAQKLLLAATSGALVLLLAGCPKTPTRPDPSSTIVGPVGSGATPGGNLNGGLGNPMDLGVPGTDLVGTNNGFDSLGQDRKVLEAHTVYFDYDQSAIKASERAKLQAAKKYLDEHPTHRLLLEGHCDWRGTAEYNLGLGDRRAGSAKKYLQSIGVDVTRLETLSKGSLEASKNADDATAAKDRRVNLVVIDPALAGGAPMGAPTTGKAM